MNIEQWDYLQTSLRQIDRFIRDAFTVVQQSGGDPASTLHGLVISEDEVAGYLEQAPLTTPWPAGTLTLPELDFQNSDNPFSRLAASWWRPARRETRA